MIKKDYQTKLQISLKKAQSLITTIEKMIDEEQHCLKIGQQVNAVLGLLRGANATLLQNHLETCGKKEMTNPDSIEREKFIAELVKIFAISGRK
jgi:DNA-binding FrmR family transcriptional regulator